MRQRPTATAALLLAGGGGSRLGGVDKPALAVGDRSMLATVLAAVAAARPRVVVGPPRSDLPPDVHRVREHPAGGGPVAAVAAGIHRVAELAPAGQVLLLAADLPQLEPGDVAQLIDSGPADRVRLVADAHGRWQYLAAAWPIPDLLRACRQPHRRMSELYAGVEALPFRPDRPMAFADVDTPAALARARRKRSGPAHL